MCKICDRIKLIKEDKNPYFVRELETGYVVIADYQYFRGYTIFLCKQCETELFNLEPSFNAKFLEEMTLVAKSVAEAFGADKMNYELLGNGDSHLHWHLFPRVEGDLGEYGFAGKGPVWWYPANKMYGDENKVKDKELEELKSALDISLRKNIAKGKNVNG